MQVIILYSESNGPLPKVEKNYFVFPYPFIHTTEIVATSLYCANHYYIKKRINLNTWAINKHKHIAAGLSSETSKCVSIAQS